MATDNDDTGEAIIAFVSGVLVGVTVTLLLVRRQCKREIGSTTNYDDYYYEGGDLFV